MSLFLVTSKLYCDFLAKFIKVKTKCVPLVHEPMLNLFATNLTLTGCPKKYIIKASSVLFNTCRHFWHQEILLQKTWISDFRLENKGFLSICWGFSYRAGLMLTTFLICKISFICCIMLLEMFKEKKETRTEAVIFLVANTFIHFPVAALDLEFGFPYKVNKKFTGAKWIISLCSRSGINDPESAYWTRSGF